MAKNAALGKAKDAKQDEFYTQLADIENELRLPPHFKGKTILCNCDDPRVEFLQVLRAQLQQAQAQEAHSDLLPVSDNRHAAVPVRRRSEDEAHAVQGRRDDRPRHDRRGRYRHAGRGPSCSAPVRTPSRCLRGRRLSQRRVYGAPRRGRHRCDKPAVLADTGVHHDAY